MKIPKIKIDFLVPCTLKGLELVEDIKKFTEKKHRTVELMRKLGTKTDDVNKMYELIFAVASYDEEVRKHIENISIIAKQKDEVKDLKKKAALTKELETLTFDVFMISILKIENLRLESANDNKELITLVERFLAITCQFDIKTLWKKPTLVYYTDMLCHVIACRDNMIVDEFSLKFTASMKS